MRVMDTQVVIDAVNHLAYVDANSSAVQAARALGVSFGDSTENAAPFGNDAEITLGLPAPLKSEAEAVLSSPSCGESGATPPALSTCST